jgi:tetratricopeptide (TPR) repeat protein
MLYDAVEKRCGLGEIAYTLATVRDSGRQTRHLLHQAVGSSSKQTVHLLTTLTNTMRSTEKEIKGLGAPQAAQVKSLGAIAELLVKVSGGIDSLSTDQKTAAEGLERLAAVVEASGVGERVRARRDARLAARAALRDGRPGAAVALLTEAESRGDDEAVANDLAAAHVQAGKPEEAGKILERVLEGDPGYTTSRITLAGLKLRADDSRGAEALLKDAPEEANPQLRAELAYARACVAYAVGRSEDAVHLLNKALDEDPWHAQAMAALNDLRARRVGHPVPAAAAIAVEGLGMKAAAEESGED